MKSFLLPKLILFLFLFIACSAKTDDRIVDWDAVEPITKDNIYRLTELAQFGNGSVSDLDWSADGRYLAAATTRGIEIFAVNDLDEQPQLLPIDSPRWVAFSPDGTHIVASGCVYGTSREDSSCQGLVYLWDMPSQQPVEIMRSEHQLEEIAFSLDGKQLAIADHWSDTLRIVDLATTDIFLAIEVPYLTCFAFNQVGDRLVTGSGSYALPGNSFAGVQIWDTQTGERLEAKNVGDVFTVGFSSDGRSVFYGAGGQTQLYRWIFDTDEIEPVIEDEEVLPDYLNRYYISHDGYYLLSPAAVTWTRSDLEIFVWDVESGHRILMTDETASVRPDILALSPDASTLAIGSTEDGVIELINIITGEHQVIYRTGYVNDVAFLDDQTIVFAGGGQTIWKWAFTQAAKPERAFLADSSGIAGILPGNRDTLWLDSFGEGVLLYDITTGTELLRFGDFTVRAVALNASQNLLAYGDWIDWDPTIAYENDEQCNPCGVLKFYDTERNQTLEFEGRHGISESIRQIEFNSSGRYVITRSEQEARVWDLESGVMTAKMDNQCSFCVFYAGFMPDDQVVVGIIDYEENVTLYSWTPDVWQSQTLLTPDNAQILLKLDRRISDIVYYPSENLVFAATPYFVRIYSLDTAQELRRLEGHTGVITSVALSNDRRFLISSGSDGVVRVWGVPTEE